MPSAHDMETTLEVDLRVDYTYKPAVEAKTNCDPYDGWPPEPAETEVQAVWLDGENILARLTQEQIRVLTVEAEGDGEREEYTP